MATMANRKTRMVALECPVAIAVYLGFLNLAWLTGCLLTLGFPDYKFLNNALAWADGL
jgi:hypothetical protein